MINEDGILIPSLRIRIITYGNSQVGKSCLIKRYCEKRFIPKYYPTIGIDYGAIKVNVQGRNVRVNIFDTSGDSAYSEVVEEFYEGNHGVLLVFDVTDRNTFLCLPTWLDQFKNHQSSIEYEDVVVLVVGNKSEPDGERPREVSKEEAQLWAHQRGLYYIETSTKTGVGVKECFQTLFLRIVKAQQKPDQKIAMQTLFNAPDSFSKLGLQHNASKQDILKAYKRLASLLHPDKNSLPQAEDAFKILGQIKNSLLS